MSEPSTVTAVDPLALLTAYQGSAVIAAVCQTGIADVLYAAEREPADVAARCGTDPRATEALLGALTALGLAEHTPAGYRLSPAGAPLASGHPRSIARIVAKEWFFYRAWADLPATVSSGHAQLEPWTTRLAGDPSTALTFLRALDDLAALFGDEVIALTNTAELPAGARLLDVGGGAGSYAARLSAAVPGLTATVLDLAPVEALQKTCHPELSFVAGDLMQPRFGRPDEERWDIVLLANILHDHRASRCEDIVRTAAGLLTPGGTLLVYEWLLDDGHDSPRAVALFDVMMMVENEGGAAYTANQIRAWLRAAGLEAITVRSGHGPISVVRGRSRV